MSRCSEGLSDSLRHTCLRAITTCATLTDCLQIWALCSKSAESVMCNWVVRCLPFPQEWCGTRRYILTIQLGDWHKIRHWVGWYRPYCKLQQSISCTHLLNSRLMTTVTHRLATACDLIIYIHMLSWSAWGREITCMPSEWVSEVRRIHVQWILSK